MNWVILSLDGDDQRPTAPLSDLNTSYLSIRLFERPIRHFPIRTGDLMSGIRLKLGSFSELWNRISWNRFRSNKINSVNCSFSTFSVIINENQLWSSCGRLSLKQYTGFPDTIVLYLGYRMSPSICLNSIRCGVRAGITVQIPTGIPEEFRNHEWVLS